MSEFDVDGAAAAFAQVAAELVRATELFPPLAGPHEGYAVILEEVDELWDEVKGGTGRTLAARSEAMQIAAMAVRYMLDVTEPFDE